MKKKVLRKSNMRKRGPIKVKKGLTKVNMKAIGPPQITGSAWGL
jgi:hypothetical protein